MKPFRFVDLFCGGGGSITGAVNALKYAGMSYEGRGFNHWDIAIKTIAANHPEIVPDFDRACAPIESVLPDEIFADDPTRIDLLWASPSCTHHSNAAAGKPKSNQLRSQPEYLLPYLRLTKVRRMFVENVVELKNWGRLLDKDTKFKGKTYKAGTADPRHNGEFFNLWYREIKASGYNVEMEVMNAADYGCATSRERLIIQAVRRSTGEKIVWPTPTYSREPGLLNELYLPWRTAAEIIDWSVPGKSIFGRKTPLAKNTLRRIEAGIKKYWGAWAEPFLIILRGTSEAQIDGTAIQLTQPLPTITCQDHIGLVSPVVMDMSHPADYNDYGRVHLTPGTFTTSNNQGLLQGQITPLIISYYGGEQHARSTKAPLPTVTTKDRFGLIEGKVLTSPDGKQYNLDITLRMLTTKELARATSFPEDYIFAGSDTDAKKQIGNAVCPLLAEALYKEILKGA